MIMSVRGNETNEGGGRGTCESRGLLLYYIYICIYEVENEKRKNDYF